ncbi:MAG: malonyl CoA-acyl carrier protein transacylase [Frankiales bacterium]|nr:malonyl CoA-acyl carrier protein transacylase [Frankiales bacterium]
MLLLLSPGQGSQSSGLLRPWLDLPGAQDRLSTWSDLTGLDLLHLGTEASDDEVRPTEVAQPLLTAAALLSGRALLDGAQPELVCGHSVGELSALALAGVLTDDEAVRLAAGRGAAMAKAAAVRPTGMVALLGGTLDEQAVRDAGLEVATVNAPGQVVLGGPVEALDAFTHPGSRLRRLDVAGAFHTRAMAPAADELAALIAGLDARDAVCDVIANADGALLRDGRELLDRLVGQLTRPVRFDLCLAAATAATSAVELAPGGVLAGLVKRALPGLPVTALKTADDLLVSV